MTSASKSRGKPKRALSAAAGQAAIASPRGQTQRRRLSRAFTDRIVSAWFERGSNCGPGAIAAITGVDIDVVLDSIEDFDARRHTNEIMLRDALDRLGARWRTVDEMIDLAETRTRSIALPTRGIVRVCFTGPWIETERHAIAMVPAWRRSHWIGFEAAPDVTGERDYVSDCDCDSDCDSDCDHFGEPMVFDFNAISATRDGWAPLSEWESVTAPTLAALHPGSDRAWAFTESLEVAAVIPNP